MTFRIKTKYVLNVDYNPKNKIWTNSIPDFTLSHCDDPYLRNNEKPDKSIYVQPDRIRFCNIFNIIDQTITYEFLDTTEKHEFILPKGTYTSKKLEELLNKMDKRIQFKFEDKNKGTLIVQNKTVNNDCIMTLHKNLILNTGLKDTFLVLKSKEKYFQVGLGKNNSIETYYNITRSLKEIKLYSKYIFNYKTEICSKTFSESELKSFFEKDNIRDVDFTISNLNSKIYKVDRFDLENCKFYFLDFLDEPLYFDFCELSVFFSNKWVNRLFINYYKLYVNKFQMDYDSTSDSETEIIESFAAKKKKKFNFKLGNYLFTNYDILINLSFYF